MAKKIILMIMMMVVLSGCGNSASDSSSTPKANPKTISLTDDDFVKWTSEITVNSEDYIGDIIHVEGLYMDPGHQSINNKYGYVYRHGLGCCGTDGGVFGYEFINDEVEITPGDWIEVSGVLSQQTEDGKTRLVLEDATVTVKDEHGTVFVGQ